MKKSVRIKTPVQDQYIELRSLQPFSIDNPDRTYVGFSEIRLVRPGRTLRWLIDDWVPAGLVMQGIFGRQQSIVYARGSASLDHLDKDGAIEFYLHISSPVIPRTNGLWVRWAVTFSDDAGLIFNGQFAAYSWDGSKWLSLSESLPDWLRGDASQWVIERGPRLITPLSLSEGNTLLCAARNAGGPQCGNLVDVDPGLDDHKKVKFCFSLVPVKLEVEGAHIWDIATDLTVSPGFGAPAPVNSYAVLLADRIRAASSLGANGMHLQCTLQEDAQYVPAGWTLYWFDVPGQSDPHASQILTLESLSEAHLSAHAYGLATVRARNRLSIVPTWVRTLDAASVCHLVFDLKRKDLNVADVRLRDILLDHPVDLIVTCGGAVGLDGVTPWQLTVRASNSGTSRSDCAATSVAGERPFLHWIFNSVDGHPNAHQIGAGSVLLSLGGFHNGELSLTSSTEFSQCCSETGGPYRRPALETSLSLHFGAAHYGPLSMDPEIGFETLSAVVKRARPWTLDLSPGGTCPALLSEVANREESRLLHIELSAPDEREITTDVMVVDPCPLTVARVRSKEVVEGKDIIAEYIDDSDQSPEWRFYTKLGEMKALLPPQGIGEEMVKGFLFLDPDGANTPVPLENSLFDFRLTPIARLMLDRTDIDIARTEPPWSLRRMLGQRPGVTGLKLERARFEMLYGLQVQVEAPELRIAELDGLVGRVPYSDALRRRRARWDQCKREPEDCYAAQVSSWQGGLWNRPSWWRVFRDASQRQTLTVDRGVTYLLRSSRQTAHPFQIGEFAAAKDGISSAWPRKPLRGGVDWPFQSRNIYQAVCNAQVSDAGSIEGLAFGALGGEGSQTASFNNGKTLIISSCRQGRLDSLTLIRVGRVTKIWNKARHVIVYERTTRRAPRYDFPQDAPPGKDDLESQPEWKGFAALRKVREYIEISQPKRRYPDSITDRPVAGPLVQSVFGSTVIPVMSSWGHDVHDGFVMALRGPIPPGKEDYFPEPQIFLDFARPDDKGGGSVSQRITSTDRLEFFSSTRDDDGGDTDTWPAWPGIDFPAIRPPAAPKLPFRSSFAGQRQPDAQPAEFGMEPYTLVLAQAEEAVNLMHGRNVAGLEAKLSNISVARGLPDVYAFKGDPQEVQQAKDAQEAAQRFAGKRAVLLDSLSDLRAGIRQLAKVDSNAVITANAQLQADLNSLILQMQANIDAGDPTAPRLDLDAMQDARNKRYCKSVQDDAQSFSNQLLQMANRASQAQQDESESVRSEAMALVDAVYAQAKDGLGNVGVVRIEALHDGGAFLDGIEAQLGSSISVLASQASQDIAVLKAGIGAQPQNQQLFENAWRESVARLTLDLRGMLETTN
jgi:hypothetical protein